MKNLLPLLPLLPLLSLLLFSQPAFGLVDYSDNGNESRFKKKSSSKSASRSKSKIKKRAKPGKSHNPMFHIDAGFESHDYSDYLDSGQMSRYKVSGHFQTNYNIFMDASYWHIASSEGQNNLKNENGNGTIGIGFNWLRFGGPADGTGVDLLAGMILGQKDSLYASSRTDKYIGVETTKAFLNFTLGLGARLVMTGPSVNEDELDIGNIRQFYGSLGWMVSNDIFFDVEVGSHSVAASDTGLKSEIRFGYFSPALRLAIGPTVGVNFGATFRTKRINNKEALAARLWELNGAYGNSLHAGLNFSL